MRISTGFIFMITIVQVVQLIKNKNHTINYVKYRIELAIREEVVPCAVGYVSAFFQINSTIDSIYILDLVETLNCDLKSC